MAKISVPCIFPPATPMATPSFSFRKIMSSTWATTSCATASPSLTCPAGGSVQGMIDAMEKATAQLPPDVKVIPGHGALSNLDDVRAFTKMLKETSAVVQKALNEHKTLDQMKQEKILAPWAKWKGDFVNEDAFIETLYNSLTGHKGEFVKHN